MKIKTLVINGIVAALYVAIMTAINPFGFLINQFRIPEMFNHLIVFNKKYFYGIVVGVFVSNLLFSPLVLDIVYGVAHSIISLIITIVICKFVKNYVARMIINTIVFSVMMFIVAYEIVLVNGFPFYPTWISLSISELLVMGVGIPVMYFINKNINFKKQI